MTKLFLACMTLLLLLPNPAPALVSEGRPGVPYFDHVLFLQSKVVQDDKVVAVSLAFADPRKETDLCRNSIDVFGGMEKFRDIPVRSWVMVDYELQSILVQDGFVGDADVSHVTTCPDAETCLELSEQRQSDPDIRQSRANKPRSETTSASSVESIEQRLDTGRKLVRAARCRGCHSIEGFGASHAPSLTWKRFKYEEGWLQDYLGNSYRMRPAMAELMMPNFTSTNAKPHLQSEEVKLVAIYLTNAATASAPNDRYQYEPWQDYDCYQCHTRLYREKPLVFKPTPMSDGLKSATKNNTTLQTCLSCHPMGDLNTKQVVSSDNPNRLASDLLLAFEKLTLNYLAAFLENPAYLEPQTRMPNLSLSEEQIREILDYARSIKLAIDAGDLKPVHTPYWMEKRSPSDRMEQ